MLEIPTVEAVAADPGLSGLQLLLVCLFACVALYFLLHYFAKERARKLEVLRFIFDRGEVHIVSPVVEGYPTMRGFYRDDGVTITFFAHSKITLTIHCLPIFSLVVCKRHWPSFFWPELQNVRIGITELDEEYQFFTDNLKGFAQWANTPRAEINRAVPLLARRGGVLGPVKNALVFGRPMFHFVILRRSDLSTSRSHFLKTDIGIPDLDERLLFFSDNPERFIPWATSSTVVRVLREFVLAGQAYRLELDSALTASAKSLQGTVFEAPEIRTMLEHLHELTRTVPVESALAPSAGNQR